MNPSPHQMINKIQVRIENESFLYNGHKDLKIAIESNLLNKLDEWMSESEHYRRVYIGLCDKLLEKAKLKMSSTVHYSLVPMR
jgi:hypothetical protein